MMSIESVMTEECFVRNLRLLIEEHRTEYLFEEITRFDTKEFRNEYKIRYTCDKLYKAIANKSNIKLIRYFPKEFVFGLISKIKERV